MHPCKRSLCVSHSGGVWQLLDLLNHGLPGGPPRPQNREAHQSGEQTIHVSCVHLIVVSVTYIHSVVVSPGTYVYPVVMSVSISA